MSETWGRMAHRRMPALCIIGLLVICCAVPALAQTPAGYVTSERPDPQGTPTKVEVALLLLDLSEVADLRQDFSVDLYVRVRWRDPRLATDESASAAVRTLPLAKVWNPAMGALNRRNISFLLPANVNVDSSGNVGYDQRIQGGFSSPLDLRDFPADEQSLGIRFASYLYGPDEIAIEINNDRSGRLEDLSVSGWEIGEPAVEVIPLVMPGGATRAGVTYELKAERQTTYYVLTMVIPLLLIAFMAWTVFWIDPSFLPSQIGISTASIFSMIAFRLGLTATLPKVAYLTLADRFVLAITILVFAAFGESVLTGSLFKAGREDLARRVDRWARWVYLVALVATVLVAMR